MSRISTNRNRSRYTYNDRQPMTKEAKQEFRQAEAELMARNEASRTFNFDVHCQPPSFKSQAEDFGAKAIAAIHRGNIYQSGFYAAEAYRAARLEAR